MTQHFVRIKKNLEQETVSRFDIRPGDVLWVMGKKVRIALRDMRCSTIFRKLSTGDANEAIGRSGQDDWWSFVLKDKKLVARPIVRPYNSPFGAASTDESSYLYPDSNQEVSVIVYEYLD